MEMILVTSAILISGIMVIRYIFGRKASARIIYALWLVAAVRLVVPINFGGSGFSILNVTYNIADRIGNKPEINSKDRVYNKKLPKSNKDNYIQKETDSKSNFTYAGDINNNDKLAKDKEAVNKDVQDTGFSKEMQNKNIENSNTPDKNAQENYTEDTGNKYIKLIIPAVWFSGSFIMLCIFVISNFKIIKVFKKERILLKHIKAGRHEVPVYIVKNISTPCLYGFLSPAIYLNEDIFERECNPDYVILHEMVHYKHRDYIWSVIRAALLCIYWFDIFVWIGAIYSKKDCEYACDESVVKIIGVNERAVYGRTLVNLVPKINPRREMLYITASFSGKKSNLKERITRIAEMGNKRKMVLTTAVMLLLIFIVGLTTFSGAKSAGNDTVKTAYNGTKPVIKEEENLSQYKYIYDNSISEPIDLRYDKQVQTYYYYIEETDAGSVLRSINSMIKKKYKTSASLYDYYSRYSFGGIKDNKPTVKEFDIHLADTGNLEYYYVNALLESDGRVRILIGLYSDVLQEDGKLNVYDNFSSNMELSDTENYIYNNPSYHMSLTEVAEFFTQISTLDNDKISKFSGSFMETAAVKMVSADRLGVPANGNIVAFKLENDAGNTKIYEINAGGIIGSYGITFSLQNRYQGKTILSGSITNERIVKSISELEEILAKHEQYKKELGQKADNSDIDFVFGDVTAVCGREYAKQKYSDKAATERLVKSLSSKDFKEAGTGDYYIANGITDSVIYKIGNIKPLGITFYHVTDMDLKLLYGVPFKYGNAFVIEQNGIYQAFPTDWTGGYPSHDVSVCAADFDRDGETEIAMCIVLDHGSECCVESLSVFDKHNGDNYIMHILDEQWFVKSVYSDLTAYYEDILGYKLDAGKMGYESFLYRDGKEDRIRIGDIIHYDMKKDGTITVNMPAINSNTGEWKYYKGDVTYFEDGSFIFYNGRVENEE